MSDNPEAVGRRGTCVDYFVRAMRCCLPAQRVWKNRWPPELQKRYRGVPWPLERRMGRETNTIQAAAGELTVSFGLDASDGGRKVH